MSKLSRFMVYILQKYCPFNVSSFQLITGAVAAFLLGLVLLLGWNFSRKVREVVTRDFNQQQLLLARHAAGQVESNLEALKKEIKLLRLSPSVQYYEKVWLEKRMAIAFSSAKEYGAVEVRLKEAGSDRTHVVDDKGHRVVKSSAADTDYLSKMEDLKYRTNLLISEVRQSTGPGDSLITMEMAAPVWQVSVDDVHPVATNRYSGVLVFVVDVNKFIERVTKGIRSGKTGYSWVIDEKGTFLYHPEEDFIGKNAFRVRKEKQPAISFSRINDIQQVMMLGGTEGMSWYTSGWHRGQVGEIRKLIAYTPIHLELRETRLWSVAVVAPQNEVEDAVHSIHLRQFLFQTIVVVVILFGSLMIITLMVNWSRTLEHEVERKTAEFKLSEEKYKSLVENAEDIIFTVDNEGRFISINGYGAKFFDIRQEDIIGRNFTEILPWPGAEIPVMTVKEVFDEREGRQITHPVKIRGKEYWLNTNFRRLFDEKGEIYAVLGISRDITDRKKVEEQMYHTERLASMGTLAAGVAHEINNPLAIILGHTDLLLEKLEQDSKMHRIISAIERQALHAKRVVQNLLSFARYSEQREEIADVNRCIETVIAVVGNTLLMKKIALNLDLYEGLPPVKTDPKEIQQVFFNLISNAVDAMAGCGGSLTISTALDDNDVDITVSDTGCGIRPEHRSRIFDPLFTTKKVGEGTGLGLSVCYGIIAKCGGAITFVSRIKDESEDTGTTFIVTIPAVPAVIDKV